MRKGILGKKIGMTQVFDAEGKLLPVTVIEAGPCVVLQKKTMENDGYEAIQVGFSRLKETKTTKPMKGHFDRAKAKPVRYIKEFRLEDNTPYAVGQEFKADIFVVGDMVDVVGISKGKGFVGAIKRHGFHRGPMKHGSKYHRGPGSLGAKGPARVFKGRKLPGRTGGDRVTIQNLSIVKVDTERNLILVRGSVPGPKRSFVIIKDTVKAN